MVKMVEVYGSTEFSVIDNVCNLVGVNAYLGGVMVSTVAKPSSCVYRTFAYALTSRCGLYLAFLILSGYIR